MPGPVERWLETFMCKQYAFLFEEYGFKTLPQVCQLQPTALHSMGIAPEHCDKILENVSILRQSLVGTIGPGCTYPDHPYENHMANSSQASGYNYPAPPPYPVPLNQQYGNPPSASIPYSSSQAYTGSQGSQYVAQEMYGQPVYGGRLHQSQPTWESGPQPPPHEIRPYSQSPRSMMGSPPPVMRSPPPGPTMGMSHHYRQILLADQGTAHSWPPHTQVPSPGMMHSPRTTPSPGMGHPANSLASPSLPTRSPAHKPPFSPPPFSPHNPAPPPAHQQHGYEYGGPPNSSPQQPMVNHSGGSGRNDPLQSLQKMVMQEPKPDDRQVNRSIPDFGSVEQLAGKEPSEQPQPRSTPLSDVECSPANRDVSPNLSSPTPSQADSYAPSDLSKTMSSRDSIDMAMPVPRANDIVLTNLSEASVCKSEDTHDGTEKRSGDESQNKPLPDRSPRGRWKQEIINSVLDGQMGEGKAIRSPNGKKCLALDAHVLNGPDELHPWAMNSKGRDTLGQQRGGYHSGQGTLEDNCNNSQQQQNHFVNNKEEQIGHGQIECNSVIMYPHGTDVMNRPNMGMRRLNDMKQEPDLSSDLNDTLTENNCELLHQNLNFPCEQKLPSASSIQAVDINPLSYSTPKSIKREWNDSGSSSESPNKKKRGRPRGSKNKPKLPGFEKVKRTKKKKPETEGEEVVVEKEPAEPSKQKKKVEKPECVKKVDVVKKPIDTKSRGPFVHVDGTLDNPISVTVVNTQNREDETDSKSGLKKQKSQPARDLANRGTTSGTRRRIAKIGYTSTLSAKYDAVTKDETWVCELCRHGSHYQGLGDLFGPYFEDQRSTNEGFPKEDSIEGEGCANADPTLRKVRAKRKRSELVEEFFKTTMAKKGRRSKDLLPRDQSGSSSSSSEVWVHEDCIVWSHGVYLVGNTVYGLEEAARVAADMVCCKCKAVGATLGCLNKGCNEQYHFICALERGCQLDEDNFSLLCVKHKKKTRPGSLS